MKGMAVVVCMTLVAACVAAAQTAAPEEHPKTCDLGLKKRARPLPATAPIVCHRDLCSAQLRVPVTRSITTCGRRGL